jgi:hypothetical protein
MAQVLRARGRIDMCGGRVVGAAGWAQGCAITGGLAKSHGECVTNHCELRVGGE